MGRLVLLLFVLAVPLSADQWPAARVTEVFSESREWFVRVTPGKSLGDTVGFAGSPKGPYATAEFYRRGADRGYRVVAERTLVNPIAPAVFFVTDRGYLVTLDNWHNRGYGKVVASYGPDGRPVAAYELRELFSAEEIAAFSHSASSIAWRTDTTYIRSGQRTIYASIDGKGTDFIVDAETGKWQLCAWQDKAGKDYRCRDTNAGRNWRGYRDGAEQKQPE